MHGREYPLHSGRSRECLTPWKQISYVLGFFSPSSRKKFLGPGFPRSSSLRLEHAGKNRVRGRQGRGGRGGRALSCLDHNPPTPRAWQSPGASGFSPSPPLSLRLLQGPRCSSALSRGSARRSLGKPTSLTHIEILWRFVF